MGKLERQFFVFDTEKDSVASISGEGIQLWIYAFNAEGEPQFSWLDVPKADVPISAKGTIIVVESSKDDPPTAPLGAFAVPGKRVLFKGSSKVTFHEGWDPKSVDPSNPWPPPPPPPPP